jgi:hypothetical protein
MRDEVPLKGIEQGEVRFDRRDNRGSDAQGR